jgi:hypothetical protein
MHFKEVEDRRTSSLSLGKDVAMQAAEWAPEPELNQPLPRRVVADVPRFREGTSWLGCGALAVAFMLALAVGGAYLAGANFSAPDPRDQLAAAQRRQQELLRLKQHGAKVEGQATTRVRQVWDRQYYPFAVEETTTYTYPGGHGQFTTGTVPNPYPYVSREESRLQMEEAYRVALRRAGDGPVSILYLPEEPDVHVVESRLDRESAEAAEQVGRFSETGRTSVPVWISLGGISLVGWIAVLAGLVQILVAAPERFFLTRQARRRRDLARRGAAVPAEVVEVTGTPARTEYRYPHRGAFPQRVSIPADYLVRYRFDGPDGTPRTGTFRVSAPSDVERFTVGARLTVLCDPDNSAVFVRYQELRGVRILPPEPEREYGGPSGASPVAAEVAPGQESAPAMAPARGDDLGDLRPFARAVAASFPGAAGCLQALLVAVAVWSAFLWAPAVRALLPGVATVIVGLGCGGAVLGLLQARRTRQWVRGVLIPEGEKAGIDFGRFLALLQTPPGANLSSVPFRDMQLHTRTIRVQLATSGKLQQPR